MTRDEALEVIGAYGADAARWPDELRDRMLALAADPEVAAALADARRLDAMLAGWAADVPEKRHEVAALLPPPVAIARPVRRGWLGLAGGGALAAALALVLVNTGIGGRQATLPGGMAEGTVLESASAAGAEDELFTLIFTPTADEDELI